MTRNILGKLIGETLFSYVRMFVSHKLCVCPSDVCYPLWVLKLYEMETFVQLIQIVFRFQIEEDGHFLKECIWNIAFFIVFWLPDIEYANYLAYLLFLPSKLAQKPVNSNNYLSATKQHKVTKSTLKKGILWETFELIYLYFSMCLLSNSMALFDKKVIFCSLFSVVYVRYSLQHPILCTGWKMQLNWPLLKYLCNTRKNDTTY